MQRTLELAEAFSSKVWILHVVPRMGEAPFNVDQKVLRHEVDVERRREKQLLEKLAQEMEKKGVTATALLAEGKVVAKIMEESDRLASDLIVLGCHKHGLLYSALMDSTDDGLLSKCVRPIMIVPVAE
jgi:nucleotide-binding universal stress UspA family protein